MNHHEYGPSKLDRLFACPGSPAMCAGLPAYTEAHTSEREEGQMLHSSMETGEVEHLDVHQGTMVLNCTERMAEIAPFESWQREVEVQLMDGENLLTFGTVDAVYVEIDCAHIIDWKFGFLPVMRCEDNKQLKAYAAGIMQKYDVDIVQAYIYQPRLRAESQACWTRSELKQYISEIAELYESFAQPGTMLSAAEHCKYCPGMAICPEYRRLVTHELVNTKGGEIVDPTVMAQMLEAAAMAKDWSDSIKHHAGVMVRQGGQTIPGWYLQSRRGKRVCTDANAAYQALVADGPFTPDQFMGFVDLGLTKLEASYADIMKAQGGQTKKASHEWINEQWWVTRESDTTVLARERKHREPKKDKETKQLEG